ncbi:MAG: MBL fold metallo-hydrolase [Coprobacillus sp.]|nr:MBL fold metallo-hydrolase [Coprobacillus sp.]
MDISLMSLGHSAFLISDSHSSVVIDPYQDGSVPGLSFPKGIKANKVIISHEHADHNAADKVEVIPQDDFSIGIREISCFHDDQGGALRGPNKIFILSVSDKKIVHLGDLGHALSEEQLDKLNGTDILLAPINGHFTLGSEAIFSLYQKVNPKIIIPMHYFKKEENSGYVDDDEIDKFLSHFERGDIYYADKSITLDDALLSKKVVIFR